MSITATRFATQLRTWLLIAALTALLIAIGGAIGGGALYVFVVLAVLMNVAGYWFSDRIALAASRARPVKPGELPELEAAVEDLAVQVRWSGSSSRGRSGTSRPLNLARLTVSRLFLVVRARRRPSP